MMLGMSRLSIYISAGCLGCQRAREIAGSLRETCPEVDVELIDVSASPQAELPEAIVAVPAYVLDGTVVSLGNPTIKELRDRLRGASRRTG